MFAVYYKFYPTSDVMSGELKNLTTQISLNKTSWGHHLNLTWEELIYELSDADFKEFGVWNRHFEEYEYYKTYSVTDGICLNIANYTITERALFAIVSERSYVDLQVFITDQHLTKYGGLYYRSHLESKIELAMNYNEYEIVVEQKSFFDPRNPDACYDYKDDEYFNCVDNEAQKVFKPTLGCNPPWISPGDQCAEIYHGEDYQNQVTGILGETGIYIAFSDYRQTSYEANCKQPCNITTSYVKLRRSYDSDLGYVNAN